MGTTNQVASGTKRMLMEAFDTAYNEGYGTLSYAGIKKFFNTEYPLEMEKPAFKYRLKRSLLKLLDSGVIARPARYKDCVGLRGHFKKVPQDKAVKAKEKKPRTSSSSPSRTKGEKPIRGQPVPGSKKAATQAKKSKSRSRSRSADAKKGKGKKRSQSRSTGRSAKKTKESKSQSKSRSGSRGSKKGKRSRSASADSKKAKKVVKPKAKAKAKAKAVGAKKAAKASEGTKAARKKDSPKPKKTKRTPDAKPKSKAKTTTKKTK